MIHIQIEMREDMIWAKFYDSGQCSGFISACKQSRSKYKIAQKDVENLSLKEIDGLYRALFNGLLSIDVSYVEIPAADMIWPNTKKPENGLLDICAFFSQQSCREN